MNKIITIIIYVFICSAALAQPSGFDHPSRYWRYSYCYYADFQSEGIPDTGADIEVYNLGEVERKGTTYQMALRVRGHLYHIPSMVDTLLYRWEGKRAYADFDDMCRVFYDGAVKWYFMTSRSVWATHSVEPKCAMSRKSLWAVRRGNFSHWKLGTACWKASDLQAEVFLSI